MLVVGTDCDLLSPTDPDLRTELQNRPHTRRIKLRPLSPDGVARALGGPVCDRTVTEYHRLTGGNPALLHGLANDQQDPRALPLRVSDGFAQAVDSCLYGLDPLDDRFQGVGGSEQTRGPP